AQLRSFCRTMLVSPPRTGDTTDPWFSAASRCAVSARSAGTSRPVSECRTETVRCQILFAHSSQHQEQRLVGWTASPFVTGSNFACYRAVMTVYVISHILGAGVDEKFPVRRRTGRDVPENDPGPPLGGTLRRTEQGRSHPRADSSLRRTGGRWRRGGRDADRQ